MIILANPIYDAVFKALLDNLEVARSILSALIGLKIIELRLVSQEHVHKDATTGELQVMRLDFCALIETADGRRYQVIIELQKSFITTLPLRFRHYLASRYLAVDEILVDGDIRQVTLPVISIYLLGYNLDPELPMVTHVTRHYQNAVTGKRLTKGVPHEFIEQLTHDAFFVQIPKIKGQMGTEMERVLSVFDQHHTVEGDKHRLEFDENLANTDPLLAKIFRILNQLQESPEMEQQMKLEDIYLLEQKLAAEEVRIELKKERDLREKAERLREEADRKREKAERKSKESDRKREAAEAEIARLKKLLENNN